MLRSNRDYHFHGSGPSTFVGVVDDNQYVPIYHSWALLKALEEPTPAFRCAGVELGLSEPATTTSLEGLPYEEACVLLLGLFEIGNWKCGRVSFCRSLLQSHCPDKSLRVDESVLIWCRSSSVDHIFSQRRAICR